MFLLLPHVCFERRRVSLGNYGVGVFLCGHDLGNMVSEFWICAYRFYSSVAPLRSNTVCCERQQLFPAELVTLLRSLVCSIHRVKWVQSPVGWEWGHRWLLAQVTRKNRQQPKHGAFVNVHYRWEGFSSCGGKLGNIFVKHKKYGDKGVNFYYFLRSLFFLYLQIWRERGASSLSYQKLKCGVQCD